jgi:hypothetical protein
MIAEMVIFSSLVAVMDSGDLNAILNQNISVLILNQIFFWQQYFVYYEICACKSVAPNNVKS